MDVDFRCLRARAVSAVGVADVGEDLAHELVDDLSRRQRRDLTVDPHEVVVFVRLDAGLAGDSCSRRLAEAPIEHGV